MRKRKKPLRVGAIVCWVVFVAFVFVCAGLIINNVHKKKMLEAEAERLEQERLQIEAEIERQRAYLDYVKTNEYRENEAHDSYGNYDDGEYGVNFD